MADAGSLENKLDGVDGARKPYSYRLVDLWPRPASHARMVTT